MSRLDVGDGGLLVGGQLVGERALELLLPVRVGRERVARDGLARGVELQQLLGHVAHGLLDARLRALPRRAAEAIERRAAGAGVLLQQVEPLDRDVQLVVARVAQLEEFLRRLGCRGRWRSGAGPRTARCRGPRARRSRRPSGRGSPRGRPWRAARRRSDGRRSSSNTSVSAKTSSPASGRRKPRDRPPVATSTAAACAISPRASPMLAAPRVDEDGDGDEVVVAQQLDDALGAARRGGDEQDTASPACRARRISSTKSPMRPRNSTAGWQRYRQLAVDAARRGGGLRVASSSTRRSPSSSSVVARPTRRRCRRARRRAAPAPGADAPRATRLGVAASQLFERLLRARAHLVRLAHEEQRPPDEVEERGGTVAARTGQADVCGVAGGCLEVVAEPHRPVVLLRLARPVLVALVGVLSSSPSFGRLRRPRPRVPSSLVPRPPPLVPRPFARLRARPSSLRR